MSREGGFLVTGVVFLSYSKRGNELFHILSPGPPSTKTVWGGIRQNLSDPALPLVNN